MECVTFPRTKKIRSLCPKFALRTRFINAVLDHGGRGKDFVGKGFATVRARLATVRVRLARGYLTGSKRSVVASVNHTPSPQLDIKFWKKRPVVASLFETPYF